MKNAMAGTRLDTHLLIVPTKKSHDAKRNRSMMAEKPASDASRYPPRIRSSTNQSLCAEVREHDQAYGTPNVSSAPGPFCTWPFFVKCKALYIDVKGFALYIFVPGPFCTRPFLHRAVAMHLRLGPVTLTSENLEVTCSMLLSSGTKLTRRSSSCAAFARAVGSSDAMKTWHVEELNDSFEKREMEDKREGGEKKGRRRGSKIGQKN